MKGRNERNEVIHVCYFGAGDHVGELEFINHHSCVADVVATGEVRAARVHRDHFEKCMVCAGIRGASMRWGGGPISHVPSAHSLSTSWLCFSHRVLKQWVSET